MFIKLWEDILDVFELRGKELNDIASNQSQLSFIDEICMQHFNEIYMSLHAPGLDLVKKLWVRSSPSSTSKPFVQDGKFYREYSYDNNDNIDDN